MAAIPRDRSPDSTLALLADGYRFISRRCRRYGTDAFETRLMLRKAICMLGPEAAELFYGGDRFTRRGAMPPTTLTLLQDRGSVQLLDGEAHRRRKGMFMSLMTPEELERIADIMADWWRMYVHRWEGKGRVVLHPEVREILCRTVCQWAGVPLPEADVAERTRELGAMIDGAGSVGPRNWRGQLLRARTEHWIRNVIRRVRLGTLRVPEDRPLHAIAWHRDTAGALLDTRVAAVEVINLLRPTVAVARFIVFAALALHEHPEYRTRLRDGDEALHAWFVHEVRRYYPFFPFVAGRVREPFEWRGRRFARGTWVLLDLYGTNHDPRVWDEPEAFRPERFSDWDGSAFNFIPQGGGDHATGHRCPGEWITIELMKRAVRLLTRAMHYDVPAQDLGIRMTHIPAIPRSRFVVTNVRRAG